MRNALNVFVMVGALLFADAVAAGELVVRYPNVNGIGKASIGFKMLNLALKKNGEPYRIEQLEDSANLERTRAQLENGQVDVIDFGSTAEFERQYLAVYFPIDRGLNGWRIPVVRQADEARFAQIRSLVDLGAFVAGQGEGWGDVAILKHDGIKVVTAPRIETLFPMLAAGRFDYIPLGANEVQGLLTANGGAARRLMADSHIVMVYPFGRLFFVRKGDTALRDKIYRGLVRAFDDGDVDRVLADDPDYRRVIVQDDLGRRTRIDLDNPYQTDAFRQIPARFFYNPTPAPNTRNR